MSLNSTSSSPEAPSRTVIDVYTERGAEYPKRQNRTHGILNKKDRMDYLLVAYSLMTKRVSDGLQRILSKIPTDRIRVLKAFEPVGAQLSLWGIMKKVISYDMGEDIVAPSTRQIETVLLGMQDLFAPVKKVVYTPPAVPTPTSPPPEPVKERATEPRTFMGFPVIDPYILAILDGLQVEEPKAATETPQHVSPQPKKPTSPGVTAVVRTTLEKATPLLPHADTPRFQPRILPPAPRRGYGSQHIGRRKWEIPPHLRSQIKMEVVQEDASPAPIVSSKPQYNIPDFDDIREALIWLHQNEKWHDIYRHIELQLRDDLAVTAYLMQQDGELRAGLIKMKGKFSISVKQIIHYLFYPDTIPTATSPIVASSSVTEEPSEEKEEKPEDALDRYIRLFDKFKFNERYMSVVRAICDLHITGDYEQFLVEREKFFQTGKKRKAAHAELFDINAALDEIVLSAQSLPDESKKMDKTSIMFELCEYRGDKGQLFTYDVTQESLYVEHKWSKRIAELLIESGQGGLFNRLLDETNESDLVQGLMTISIKIPRLNRHKWRGYEEVRALDTKLYFVFEDMVEHQHRGGEWNGHVTIDELKDLMKKIDVTKT